MENEVKCKQYDCEKGNGNEIDNEERKNRILSYSTVKNCTIIGAITILFVSTLILTYYLVWYSKINQPMTQWNAAEINGRLLPLTKQNHSTNCILNTSLNHQISKIILIMPQSGWFMCDLSAKDQYSCDKEFNRLFDEYKDSFVNNVNSDLQFKDVMFNYLIRPSDGSIFEGRPISCPFNESFLIGDYSSTIIIDISFCLLSHSELNDLKTENEFKAINKIVNVLAHYGILRNDFVIELPEVCNKSLITDKINKIYNIKYYNYTQHDFGTMLYSLKEINDNELYTGDNKDENIGAVPSNSFDNDFEYEITENYDEMSSKDVIIEDNNFKDKYDPFNNDFTKEYIEPGYDRNYSVSLDSRNYDVLSNNSFSKNLTENYIDNHEKLSRRTKDVDSFDYYELKELPKDNNFIAKLVAFPNDWSSTDEDLTIKSKANLYSRENDNANSLSKKDELSGSNKSFTTGINNIKSFIPNILDSDTTKQNSSNVTRSHNHPTNYEENAATSNDIDNYNDLEFPEYAESKSDYGINYRGFNRDITYEYNLGSDPIIFDENDLKNMDPSSEQEITDSPEIMENEITSDKSKSSGILQQDAVNHDVRHNNSASSKVINKHNYKRDINPRSVAPSYDEFYFPDVNFEEYSEKLENYENLEHQSQYWGMEYQLGFYDTMESQLLGSDDTMESQLLGSDDTMESQSLGSDETMKSQLLELLYNSYVYG